MILDVGCGHRPVGDVNVDLFPHATKHRTLNNADDGPLDVTRIQNFVKADAAHLPFRDGAFTTVYSSHLIEHLADPTRMVKELLRVASYSVTIKCPHRLNPAMKRNRFHKHSFNIKWFNSLSEKLRMNCEAEYSAWRYLPNIMCPLLRIPLEITVTFQKNGVHHECRDPY